ncbi:uncharacterized protein [Primulina huaijiensis]|uniref:uncharacterized protein n=1 Tax=Primulina huaijiensis TaxID=1492673 RepID=UPI003CC7711F
MKVIKSLKKLKFWPRKKRKTKLQFTTEKPPPRRPAPSPPLPAYHAWHNHYQPVSPSAPPLPPWLEFDHESEETLLQSEVNSASTSSDNSRIQAQFSPPELINDTPTAKKEKSPADSSSYQQYLVPNPVYGTPVVLESKKSERANGDFGCVLNIGVHMVRCVFPCFHIREA